jgi:uncharacterized membrane protein
MRASGGDRHGRRRHALIGSALGAAVLQANTLETVVLQTRLALLELVVLQLSVAVRFSAGVRPLAAAVRETLEDLEACGRALEENAHLGAALQELTEAERTLFADEFREMIEQMKKRASALAAE